MRCGLCAFWKSGKLFPTKSCPGLGRFGYVGLGVRRCGGFVAGEGRLLGNFPRPRQAQKPDRQRQEEGQAGAANVEGVTWKFQAAQLTYNATTAERASTDEVALQALFCRFNASLRQVADSLEAVCLSTTMERGTSSDHVHCHAYMHLSKAFHRRGRGALEVFRLAGIAPHVQPNTASGCTYIGAVRHGHFYVVVQNCVQEEAPGQNSASKQC